MYKTYKIDELAEEANVSGRTIRYYVQRGLLPAPEFRGKDTAYSHVHLLRLKVIKRLQGAHLPLDEIQSKLAGASERDLERMLGDRVDIGDAGGVDASGRGSGGRGGPYRSPGYQDPLPPMSTPVTERWDRVRLAPGLELHVRSDAGPEARRAAREIQSQYGQGSFMDDDRGSSR